MFGNNGKHYDLLADQGRMVLDRLLREKGGEDLVRLEHNLRLFNELLELCQNGHIDFRNAVLYETAQELRDTLCAYETLLPVGWGE